MNSKQPINNPSPFPEKQIRSDSIPIFISYKPEGSGLNSSQGSTPLSSMSSSAKLCKPRSAQIAITKASNSHPLIQLSVPFKKYPTLKGSISNINFSTFQKESKDCRLSVEEQCKRCWPNLKK